MTTMYVYVIVVEMRSEITLNFTFSSVIDAQDELLRISRKHPNDFITIRTPNQPDTLIAKHTGTEILVAKIEERHVEINDA